MLSFITGCKRKRESSDEKEENSEKKQAREALEAAFVKVKEDYTSCLGKAKEESSSNFTICEKAQLGEVCSSEPLSKREKKLLGKWRTSKENEEKTNKHVSQLKSELSQTKNQREKEKHHDKRQVELLHEKLYTLETKLQETQEEIDDLRDFSSKGMKIVKKVLKRHKIKFETETKIDDPRVRRRRYDISFSYVWERWKLEFDGIQHFDPKHKWHTPTSEKDDQDKTTVAIEHGFNMIRISYLEESQIEFHILRALKERKKLYLSNSGLYARIGIFEGS
jgi:hypothetical protein